MRKRSGQVHSRESSATLQLTVSLLYRRRVLTNGDDYIIIVNKFFNRNRQNVEDYRFREAQTLHGSNPCT